MGFFGCAWKKVMAESVGFEPTIPVKVYTLSKRAPSATRPSLRRKDGTEAIIQPVADTGGKRLFAANFANEPESGSEPIRGFRVGLWLT